MQIIIGIFVGSRCIEIQVLDQDQIVNGLLSDLGFLAVGHQSFIGQNLGYRPLEIQEFITCDRPFGQVGVGLKIGILKFDLDPPILDGVE